MVVPHLSCPPPNNSALPLQQSQYSGFLLSAQSVATAQSLQAVSFHAANPGHLPESDL